MTEISFKDLPLYSYDYDTNYPPVAIEFKDAIAAVDAVLFVTPEYNRSIPGGLKNAIDWASRPYGKNAFTRKPSAFIGTSPGKIGTAIAQQHLRSILAFCNSPQMNSIEAYIQFERGLITEDSQVTNETTREFLAELHGGVPRLHCARLYGAATQRVAPSLISRAERQLWTCYCHKFQPNRMAPNRALRRRESQQRLPDCPTCHDSSFVRQEQVITGDKVIAFWNCSSCLRSWPALVPRMAKADLKVK